MTKKVSEMKSDEIKEAVRDAYSRVAEGTWIPDEREQDCCDAPAQATSSCCGPREETKVTRVNLAQALGYDTEDMPTGATESFAGCGNPVRGSDHDLPARVLPHEADSTWIPIARARSGKESLAGRAAGPPCAWNPRMSPASE